MRINALASLGAVLAFVSLMTAWEFIYRGSDYAFSTPMFFFLAFVCPVSIITPLAAYLEVPVLLYTLSLVYEEGWGSCIEPYYSYVIAWVSVVLMAQGMTMPILIPSVQRKPTLAERLLTVTVRRKRRP